MVIWGLALGALQLLLTPQGPGSGLAASRAVQHLAQQGKLQVGVACIPSFLRVVAQGMFWVRMSRLGFCCCVPVWWLLLLLLRVVLPYRQHPARQE